MEAVAGHWILQTTGPNSLFDLPGSVRGLLAFVLVLVVGAGILWRYGGLVERTIDASIHRPLSSLGYGIAAHLTIVFFGLYAVNQLGQITVSGRSAAEVGLWAGVGVLVAVAALGFTVVGAAVVEIRWGHRRWYGLLLGACVAGVAGLVDPLVGGLLWLVVVSTGVGGPVRKWFHAAEDVESVR